MPASTPGGVPNWYRAALSPASIAIIGASSNPAKNLYQQQLLAYGFGGNIYPINPREKEIEGLPAYASIRAVPEPVDLALIALPAHAVPGAVADCVAAEVGVVYAFASGFSESGPEGAEIERQICTELAKSGGRTRMLGPNGTGVLNAASSMVAVPLAASNSPLGSLSDGGIALASQSGLVASATFIASQSKSPAVGKTVAIGNETDLGLADVIEGFVADDEVAVILAYLEGLRQPKRFVEAARTAREHGKPIVALKGGTTEAGAAAAASHTASLAGGDAVFSGVLAQAGVHRATSVAHLIDVASVLRAYPNLTGRRVTTMTSSGGLGIMLTDLLVRAGFELPPWGSEERQTLRGVLKPFVSVGNPLDGAGDFAWARSPLEAAIRCADTNAETDVVVIALGGMPDGEESVAEVLPTYCKQTAKPVLVAWVGGTGRAVDALNAAGLPTFDDLQRLAEALQAAVSPAVEDKAPAVATEPGLDEHALEQMAGLLRDARGDGLVSLDEVASKALLRSAGIAVADEEPAVDADAAVAAADRVGYPLVLKLRAPGLMHKSELGAISLNVRDEATVRRETKRLLAIAADQGITAADIVVQRQVSEGVELLLGMTRDAVFGPVVTLGLGGVLTEALGDVQVFTPDIDRSGFLRAFASLRHQKLLHGYRHLPAVDVEQLWTTVSHFAALVRQLPDDVLEIDVNPLIAEADGSAIAVDALVVLSSAAGTKG